MYKKRKCIQFKESDFQIYFGKGTKIICNYFYLYRNLHMYGFIISFIKLKNEELLIILSFLRLLKSEIRGE